MAKEEAKKKKGGAKPGGKKNVRLVHFLGHYFFEKTSNHDII